MRCYSWLVIAQEGGPRLDTSTPRLRRSDSLLQHLRHVLDFLRRQVVVEWYRDAALAGLLGAGEVTLLEAEHIPVERLKVDGREVRPAPNLVLLEDLRHSGVLLTIALAPLAFALRIRCRTPLRRSSCGRMRDTEGLSYP